MLVFEIMALLIIGVIAIVTVAAVGRPIAEAYSEKLKSQYRELGSQKEKQLQDRIGCLEEDVRELKNQMKAIQDTADFAAKLLEEKGESVRLVEKEPAGK